MMLFPSEPEPQAPKRPDCPGCGEPTYHDDDFCHECGHSFEHFGLGDDELPSDTLGADCPICAGGELVPTDHGRTQCDSCGYMPRDEG